MRKGRSGKSKWALILSLMAGITIGGLLGDVCVNALNGAGFTWLNWLSFGRDFGIKTVTLDLSILCLTLGFTVKFTVCGVVGMIIAYLIYRKV